MKKIISFLLIALLLFAIAGCGGNNEEQRDPEQLQQDTYSVLNKLIQQPHYVKTSQWYDKPITFSAFISDEPFETEITYETEEGDISEFETLQEAFIARNFYKPFLLIMSNIEEKFEPGSVVSVNGKISGYITFTDADGQDIEELEITATDVKLLSKPGVETNTTDSISLKENELNGDFKFIKSHIDTYATTDYIALYFEFTNNGDKAISPDMNRFHLYQGEKFLYYEPTYTGGSNLDPDATLASISNTTDPGETTYYIAPFAIFPGSSLTDQNIDIFLLNDDFADVYEYSIEIDTI